MHFQSWSCFHKLTCNKLSGPLEAGSIHMWWFQIFSPGTYEHCDQAQTLRVWSHDPEQKAAPSGETHRVLTWFSYSNKRWLGTPWGHPRRWWYNHCIQQTAGDLKTRGNMVTQPAPSFWFSFHDAHSCARSLIHSINSALVPTVYQALWFALGIQRGESTVAGPCGGWWWAGWLMYHCTLCGRGCNGSAQLCVKCYVITEARGSKRILWEKHYLSWPWRVE